MKLEQLMEGVPFTLVQGSLDTEIADIIYDSRKAAPGLLFVCIVGTQRDSHTFAADCAAKGVSALVIQHDIDLSAMPGVTVVKVESSRYAMALMSANLFGNPARQMTMIGVTGTKGKTTTTHMIKSVLEAAGRKVGMIGTNGIYYMGRHKDTANTTPESYELQKTFREFLDAGCDTALMEVSSQGLMMDRVAGVHYDVGVFTNLSPDHIGPGEHKTFEEYRSWKGKLFQRCDIGVVNIDDANTEALLAANSKLAEMVRQANTLVLSDNMAITRSVAASGTAQVAAAANNYHREGDTNIIQNIYSKAQTAADLQREARWEADRAKAQKR